jgi:hypothetical protein
MPATAVSSLAADLVVLSADPAADVRNVRKIGPALAILASNP